MSIACEISSQNKEISPLEMVQVAEINQTGQLESLKIAEAQKHTETTLRAMNDTISLSQEVALHAAQKLAAESTVSIEKLPEDGAGTINWGPDLSAGWNDNNFLKSIEGGYSGSFSFVTKYGHRVNVSSESNEDGTVSDAIYVTVQQANGDTLRTKLGLSLLINEDEQGVSFSASNQGTDGNDIIISKGFNMTGGKGDDTLISLGLPGAKGEDAGVMLGEEGDDTLVHLGDVGSEQRIDTGRGRDSVLMRAYSSQSDKSLLLGEGENRVVIDTVHKDAQINSIQSSIGRSQEPAVANEFILKEMHGTIRLHGKDANSIQAETVTGSLKILGNGLAQGSNSFSIGTLAQEASIDIAGNSSTQLHVDVLDGKVTKYHKGDDLTNTINVGALNGKLDFYNSGNNTITVDTLNGYLGTRDITYFLGDTPLEPRGLENNVSINTVAAGKAEITGKTTATINTIITGQVEVFGSKDSTTTVDLVQEEGTLSVVGNLALRESSGRVGQSNGTAAIEKSTGYLWFSNSTATVGSQAGYTGLNNTTATFGSLAGGKHDGPSMAIGGTVDLTAATITDSRDIRVSDDTTALTMKVQHMEGSFLYLNAGNNDIQIDTMHNSGIAMNLYGEKSAHGSVQVNSATESIFYGKGIDVANASDCIFTQNDNVWRAAQIFGIRATLEFMRKLGGEDIFEETGLLRKDAIARLN